MDINQTQKKPNIIDAINVILSKGQKNEGNAKVADNTEMSPTSLPKNDTQPASFDVKSLPSFTNQQRQSYQPDEADKQNSMVAEKAIQQELSPKDQLIQNAIKNAKENEVTIQPIDEKKQLFDELVKTQLKGMMTPTQNPITRAGDIVPAFQQGVGSGLSKLADYLGTSQGQNVLSGLAGALGGQNMQLALHRGAMGQYPIEQAQVENAMNTEQQRQHSLADLTKSYLTSTKGTQTMGNVLEAQLATGQITPEQYQQTISQPNWASIKDTPFSATTINKMAIDPKLKTQQLGNAKELEGLKLKNKKIFWDATLSDKENLARLQAALSGENTIRAKETPPGLTEDQKRAQKAAADKAEADAISAAKKAKGNGRELPATAASQIGDVHGFSTAIDDYLELAKQHKDAFAQGGTKSSIKNATRYATADIRGDKEAQLMKGAALQLRVPAEKAMTGRGLGINTMTALQNAFTNPASMTYDAMVNLLQNAKKEAENKKVGRINALRAAGYDTADLENLYGISKSQGSNSPQTTIKKRAF